MSNRKGARDEKALRLLRELVKTQPYVCLLGIEVVDAGRGWVREKLPITSSFLQPSVVHGGAIYSLADTAAAHSLLTLIYPNQWPTTVEQKINFLRPVTRGEILCQARVVHLGKTLAYVEAEILNDKDELIARSVATLMRLGRDRSGKGHRSRQ